MLAVIPLLSALFMFLPYVKSWRDRRRRAKAAADGQAE